MKLRNRYISREKIRDNSVQYSSEKNIKEVTHVGLLKNGYVDGPVWEFLQGGSKWIFCLLLYKFFYIPIQ